jgi:hypothetical protein
MAGRGKEHRANADHDEVSDLQPDGERKRCLHGRADWNLVNEVEGRNGGDAGRSGWNQAENPIAGTERRAAQNTEDRYHELVSMPL